MIYRAGMKIGQYVLIKLIGSMGGEADVWEANHESAVDAVYALKLRPPRKLSDTNEYQESQQRLLN